MQKCNIFDMCSYIRRFPIYRIGTSKGLSGTISSTRQYQVQQPKITRPDSKLLYGKQKKPLSYFLLIVPVVTFGLGTWQIQRRKWKLNLIQVLEERPKLSPVPLPENLSDLKSGDMEYRRVAVTGSFDHSRELHIHPRSPVQDDDVPGSYKDHRYGLYVVTAFDVKDSDVRILVNRGWVPPEHRDPKTRAAGQVEGEIEIIGINRHKSRKPPFARNNPERNDWLYRDTEQMARELNAQPVFLDLVESCSPQAENSPLGGQTRVSLRNEHLSYIITWYGLSLATSLMWYSRYVKHK